jgi:hypothetical protein
MIEIIKEDGSKEPFDDAKFLQSLSLAGAPDTLASDILRHVTSDLREGMKTDDIYAHAFNILKKEYRPAAAQYSLKRAIMELGPSGFPFERFIARILEAEGYTTKVGVMVRGKCVEHEVDVVAEKEGERVLIEAKYHNNLGTKTDVKVALYVDARMRDIAAAEEEKGDDVYHRSWLITNTSFTTQAIAYGRCSGLMMTGWNHPRGYTLEDLIRKAGTHPVTALTTLTQEHKRELLDRGAVLCKDVLGRTDLLRSMGVSEKELNDILEETGAVCTI